MIRNIALLITIVAFSAGSSGAQTGVCPVTDNTNTDCAFVLTIGPNGSATIAPVSGNPRPFGNTDETDVPGSLVGIVNNSGAPFTGTFTLQGMTTQGSDGIFDFEDGNGICAVLDFGPAYCNGAATGYEGPLVTFSNISSSYYCDECLDTGTINIKNLPSGGTTYFSLNGNPSLIVGGTGISVIGGGRGSGPVCPIVAGATNTDCAFILTINANGTGTITQVANAAPYDSDLGNGSLVGVINNTGRIFTGNFTLSGTFDTHNDADNSFAGIFDFSGDSESLGDDSRTFDGICNYAENKWCDAEGNSETFSGYEGPQILFSNTGTTDCSTCHDTGRVNITNLPANAATYFSLQGDPASIIAAGGINLDSGGATRGSGTVCPTTSHTNSDCGFVLTINPDGSITGASPGEGANAYDAYSSSSLVGVVNNSGTPFTGNFVLKGNYSDGSGEDGIFDFDDFFGDGICEYVNLSYCPAEFAYEGPLVTFSNAQYTDNCAYCSATVNINNLPVGSTTYFSILGAPSDIMNNGGLNLSPSQQQPPPPSSGPISTSSVDLGTVAVGSAINASVSASGGAPPYSYTTVGVPPPGISVNGGNVTGAPTQPGNFLVTISVTDSSGAGASGSVSFSAFGFASSTLPAGVTFSPYVASVGVSGGTSPYRFTFAGLPKGLSATSSGTIDGTLTSPTTSQVTVTATEDSGVSVSRTFTLTFSAPGPLSVPSQTLPAAQISTTYSQSLNASGGAPPYTWSLLSGSLPVGMSLRPTGVISGIPSQAGTFNFGARATDATGASAGGAVSLTISPAPITVTTGATSSNGTATPSISASIPGAVANVEYPSQMISAIGGVAPYTFAVTGGNLPSGLTMDSTGLLGGTPTSSGNFTFTVTATDSSGNAVAAHDRSDSLAPRATGANSGSATFTVPVRPFSTDLLLTSSGLTFSLIAGSTGVPPAQVVGVQSTSTSSVINYSVSVNPSTVAWLTATPPTGATPSTVSIALNSQALSLAAASLPYQATVSVTCLAPAPCAGNSQQITVSVNVTSPPPMLTVSDSLISFSSLATAPAASSQSLTIQNTGGGAVGIASVSCAASWCSVAGVPGSIGPGPAIDLTVTADPTGLSAGFYRTLITIKASTGVYVVPVTLFIANAGSMTLAPSGSLFLSAVGGTPNGSENSFLVDVNTPNPITWSASVLPGASWLTLQNTDGTASASQPGTVNFNIDPGIVASLPAKTYYGTIQVSSAGLVNSPQSFQVVLNISAAGTQQRPEPSPAGLLFISAASATPPPQTVSLSTNSTSPVSFQASASTNDGGSWLSVSPSTGAATPTSGASIQVSVNPANLKPGVYYGGVNFAYTGAAVRTTNVTLLLTAAVIPREVSHASCSPTQLVAAQTGLVSNFAAPVAWPTPISIQLLNDCATPVTNGQVVATFSNGDPALPLTLADANSGLYSATWTPRHSSPQISINAKAVAPGLPSLTAQLAGSVTPNAAPLIAPNGTLNLFNPQPGAALAPGSLIQISGTSLSGVAATATAPLPATLSGAQVIVGGLTAPLSAASPTSLTAQLPFELAPAMQYQVVVSANGALTTPATIQLSGTAPGISANAAGLVLATHVNGAAVTETAPAAPGEILVLLAVGLGATDTAVADGTASPSMPLANALDMPSVTINNEPAQIQFAGLQPGMVGIYQINVQVPSDAPNGDLNLVLSQDGNPANTTILPVKK